MSTAKSQALQIVNLSRCGETHEKHYLECMGKRFGPPEANITHFSEMRDRQVMKGRAK